MKSRVLFLLLSCILLGCTNETIPLKVERQKPKSSSQIVSAKAKSVEFVSNFIAKTRANYNQVRVHDIVCFTTDSLAKLLGAYSITSTRVSTGRNTPDTLFYVVNLADSKGYTLVSPYDKEEPILAYIENGNFSIDSISKNNGFKTFIANVKEPDINLRPSDRIDDNHERDGGRNHYPDHFSVIKPLLVTRWNQKSYNQYCNNFLTGCVPTAMAQIVSYLGYPSKANWNDGGPWRSFDINWEAVRQEARESAGVNILYRNQISLLMRYLGWLFGTEYSTDGSSTNSKDAILRMRMIGCSVSNLSDYHVEDVVRELRNNNIIFMRGYGRYYHVWFVFRKYVDGHAWVVDGCIDEMKNGKQYYYVHCNWGWGYSQNGYYRSDILNADPGTKPVYNDSVVKTRGQNFRYKLETATFRK